MADTSPKSFEHIQLLIQHQAALRGFIISLIPGSQDVEDVMQDTNLVLWEKIDSFQLDTNFRAWAFTVAKNVVMAYFRRSKRDQAPLISRELIEVVAETWYSRVSEPSSSRELALDHCLSRLSASELGIVKDRYHKRDGIDRRDELSSRSAGSLRVSLFRIRTKLRECIKSQLALGAAREGGAV